MSDTQILYFLAATILIPCIIGLLKYKGLKSIYKHITILLIIGSLTEALMIILSMLKVNNLFAVHFYAIAEIALLSLFYYSIIQHLFVKRLVILVMIGLIAFAIGYAITGSNIAEFNSIPRALECIYFTTLSCWLFYEMADHLRPVQESEYYLNGTLMFYFSSCFVIFAFNKYAVSNQEVLWTMVKAHAYVNALCNLAYAAGLWIASKTSYQQSSPSI